MCNGNPFLGRLAMRREYFAKAHLNLSTAGGRLNRDYGNLPRKLLDRLRHGLLLS
jgi:hypothetical protein